MKGETHKTSTSKSDELASEHDHEQRVRGVIAAIVLLVLVVTAALLYLRKADNNTIDTASDTPAPELTQETSSAEEGYVLYADEQTNASFYYPETWGQVNSESFTGYLDFNYEEEVRHYQQITFSNQSDVEIRLMVAMAFEGGRGFESPGAAANYFHEVDQSFAHRYSMNDGKFVIYRSVFDTPSEEQAVELVSPTYSVEQNPHGTTNVLLIKTNFTFENLGYEEWTEIDEENFGTRAENEQLIADANKRSMYVVNFASGDVIGVNGVYDWGDGEYSSQTDAELAKVLGSLVSTQKP